MTRFFSRHMSSSVTVNICYLRDLATETPMTIIPCEYVKDIVVPQFDGLSIQDILALQNDREVGQTYILTIDAL